MFVQPAHASDAFIPNGKYFLAKLIWFAVAYLLVAKRINRRVSP